MSPEARERSFDTLARGLASGTLTRGKALKLMGAALVGGTLSSLGIGGIAAADLCKGNGKVCKKSSQCCSGKCEGGTCVACKPSGTSVSSRCSGNSECCSGICSFVGFRFLCSPCRAMDDHCTSGSDCCSGVCSNNTCKASGAGAFLTLCTCADGAQIAACDSPDCSTTFADFCTTACASRGSTVTDASCTPKPEDVCPD